MAMLSLVESVLKSGLAQSPQDLRVVLETLLEGQQSQGRLGQPLTNGLRSALQMLGEHSDPARVVSGLQQQEAMQASAATPTAAPSTPTVGKTFPHTHGSPKPKL